MKLKHQQKYDQFKGFEYKVGEKKFRFNVKDGEQVKTQQSDLNNFVKKFLDKNNVMNDAEGYHKSLFTANNPDAVAKHFYEQGKADAIKDSIAKSKNINMDPRQAQSNVIPTSGWSVKAVPGDSVSDFKVKIRK
jgi:predicted PolB exonuclease-like 3'-5' exonuclease